MSIRRTVGWVLMACVCWGCSSSSESPSGTAEVPATNGQPYHVEVKAPASTPVGQPASTQVVVTPQQGFKINLEYPAKLTLGTVPAGANVSAKAITKAQMSVTKMRLTVPVSFTAAEPGPKHFEGELRFSVCNDQTCQMPRETVSWTTQAEATP